MLKNTFQLLISKDLKTKTKRTIRTKLKITFYVLILKDYKTKATRDIRTLLKNICSDEYPRTARLTLQE